MKPHPIEFEVFKNLYLSIAEEMGVTLCRTGFSPNIKERLDYSCAVYDAAGETIAQGDLVLARVHFTGRGAGSGIEVDIEAGHLIRFRDRLIVEFSAFATWQMALEEAGLAEPSAP